MHPGHWPQGQRCPHFSAQDVAARVGQCPTSAAPVSRGPPWVSGGLRDRGRPRCAGERPCSAPARPAGGLIPASEADVAALLPTLTRTAGDLDFVTGRNKGKNGHCDYGCFISKHFLRRYVFRAVFIHSKTERKMEPPRAPCTASSTVDAPHLTETPVTAVGPTWTRHCHPKPTVHIGGRAWCCAFCGSGQLCEDMSPASRPHAERGHCPESPPSAAGASLPAFPRTFSLPRGSAFPRMSWSWNRDLSRRLRESPRPESSRLPSAGQQSIVWVATD